MDNENELYSSDVESDDDFMKIPENIDSLPFDTNGNPVNKDDDMIPLSSLFQSSPLPFPLQKRFQLNEKNSFQT